MLNDGVAYVLRVKFLLERDNLPMPVAIVLNEKMFEDIEHAYPAVSRFMEIFDGEMKMATVQGVKIYKEKE